MTLAALVFVGIVWTSSAPGALPVHSAQQQPAAAEKPADSAQSPSPVEPNTATPQTPAATAPAAPPKKPVPTHRKKKKTVAATSCAPVAVTGAPAAGTGSADEAAKNCPPAKVVVRQGGTAEPSIQLDGGASGDQAVHQRETANQMLSATDMNLKKLDGKKLTASQQDMVNQVRQFMQQAKGAVATGDTERARTLAWKAQLLSEEVVKAQR